MINYYFDDKKILKPFTIALEANEGSLTPDNALRIEPSFENGFWPCELDGKWVQVKDNRGKNVYSIATQDLFVISELGEIPQNFTEIPPNNIYDSWNGSAWVEDAEKKATYLKSLVPTSITKRQAMLQLNKAGLYETVTNLINSADNLELKIEFDCASTFERESNFINAVGSYLNLNSEAIDNLFIEASKL